MLSLPVYRALSNHFNSFFYIFFLFSWIFFFLQVSSIANAVYVLTPVDRSLNESRLPGRPLKYDLLPPSVLLARRFPYLGFTSRPLFGPVVYHIIGSHLWKKLWKPLLIVKERAKKTLFPHDMTGSQCCRFHHTIGSIFQALSFFFYIFLFLFNVFLLRKPWLFVFFPFSILFLRYSNKALQSKFSTLT